MAHRERKAPEPNDSTTESFTRRHFLSIVGVGALGASTAGSSVLFVQYASPNVLYEPAQFFRAGRPDEYELGVDERWKAKQKIWIVRKEDGLYALVSICTHLGCTPNLDPEERLFKCPCHGSVFTYEGDVIAGPAPEPLYRAPIRLDDEGRMIIGTGLLGYGRPGQANREPERDGSEYVVRIT